MIKTTYIILNYFIFTYCAIATASASQVTPDKFKRISDAANLVALQSDHRARVEEAIKAVGPPTYVVEAKSYKRAKLPNPEYDSAFILIWDHEGCILSYLDFSSRGQVNGVEARGVTYSDQHPYNRPKRTVFCPDSEYAYKVEALKPFKCGKTFNHKYCKTGKTSKGVVRDTTLNRRAIKESPSRMARIESQFSSWSGAHIKLEAHIKDQMHDPSSYKHIETKYFDSVEYILVITKFRGKNAFGANVLNTVRAKLDMEGNVLEFVNIQ